MSDSADIERLIGNARAHINAGRQCLALKQPVDLSSLETLATEITAQLSLLPRDVAPSQRNALIILFDEVGQLDEAVTVTISQSGLIGIN